MMSRAGDLVAQMEQLQRDLELSDGALAAILAVSPRTVNRWHRGNAPGAPTRQRLDSLWELRTRVWELFSSPDQMVSWLHASSAYLGGLSPAEALRAGPIDRVRADLDALAGGIYQ